MGKGRGDTALFLCAFFQFVIPAKAGIQEGFGGAPSLVVCGQFCTEGHSPAVLAGLLDPRFRGDVCFSKRDEAALRKMDTCIFQFVIPAKAGIQEGFGGAPAIPGGFAANFARKDTVRPSWPDSWIPAFAGMFVFLSAMKLR